MVPDIARPGHSFKGAMAYYLHDKRQEPGAAQPSTSERVAWTETRNMMAAGPQTATRIMIATAERADELKAAAGVKNTGRKSKAHVYAYSLAWHPDEAAQLDRAEMLRAVDGSLKALGAEQHQAVIVCHRDQKHPHVHVIVNRVHPETGRMLSTSNDRHKLSDWANAYERERGLILTPAREEKRQRREQARAAFEQAASPDRSAQDPAKSRSADSATRDPQQRPARLERKPALERRPERKPSEAAMLKELHDAQKVRHRQEWTDLAARNKAARDTVYQDFGGAIREAAARHKTETRPAWAAYFRAARMDERAFHARERSIVGVLQNALAATRMGEQRSLSALFNNVLSASSREAAFKAAQATARMDFAARVKSTLDRTIDGIKQERQAALAAQRQTFMAERAALIERQNGERAKMREAWRQVYERRGKDPRYSRSQQRERGPVKDDFDKSKQLPGANRAPHPTKQHFIARPTPAPAPAGVPTPPTRRAENVPVKELPPVQVRMTMNVQAPWRAAAQPAPEQKPAPTPQREQRRATPAPAKEPPRQQQPTLAAPAPPQPVSSREQLRRTWAERAKAREAERDRQAPDRPRDRSKDNDYDRER